MGDDNLFSLWYEPWKNKWQGLGYDSVEEVEADWGKMFFEYDTGAAERVDAKADLSIEHANEKIADYGTKAQLELDMKARINQFNSEFEMNKASREKQALKDKTRRSKAMKTLNALTGLYEGANAYGSKGGIKTGSWDSKKKMAVDSVTSQIDAAMASSAFKRKSNRLKLDKFKSETGYYGEDGWVHGTDYLDAETIMDRDQALRLSAAGRSEESIRLGADHAKQELYDDWIVGSLDMYNTIMAQGPEGPNECFDNNGNIIACPEDPSATIPGVIWTDDGDFQLIDDDTYDDLSSGQYFDSSDAFADEENCITDITGSTTCG